MKYTSLALFSKEPTSGDITSTVSDAAKPTTGDGTAPAAEETSDKAVRRKIYDEFIEANKDFYTEDTQKIINRRFKEVKATEAALKAANLKLSELERETPEIIPPSDDFLKAHPDFSLENELQNKNFRLLYEGGADLTYAYNATHFDELVAAACKEAEARAVRATLDSVMARGIRIREEAGANTATAPMHRDVKGLSKNERAELARRALSGESVTFD